MSAFEELMAFQRQTEALAQVAGRSGLGPGDGDAGGRAGQRAEEIGGAGRRAARTADRSADGEWLAAAKAPDAAGEAQLRLIRRSYARTMKVPAKLAEEIATTMSLAQGVWADCRAKRGRGGVPADAAQGGGAEAGGRGGAGGGRRSL
jgi:carboxypeptidase Taq